MRRQKSKATPAYRAYVELEKNQHRPSAEIAALNWEKRRRLLVYAFQTIPFYQARFRAMGFKERDFSETNVWSSIPILTRKEVAEHFNEIRAPGWPDRDCYLSTTGGTTGKPLAVLHDATVGQAALSWRMTRWWGVEPGSSLGRIGRLTAEEAHARPGRLSRGKRGFNEESGCKVRLSVAHLDEEAIRRFLDDWNSARPSLLTGYVGGIHHVAGFILHHGLRVHRPKAVLVTTAPLTSVVRAIIEKGFQAPVYDQYGSCEVFWLAAECRRHQGLHIFSDARHLEFVEERGQICPPDVVGRILVTDLENRAFPLIRYENGDRGCQLSRVCDCGVNLPLMNSVKGRVSDAIRFKDGTVIEGVYLTTIFDGCPDAVSAFQVRQYADYSVTLFVVPNTSCPHYDEDILRVQTKLVEKMRGREPVRVVRVPEIPDKLGKTQYVISEVAG